MDIQFQITDDHSVHTVLRRAIIGIAAKKGRKTYVTLALADALADIIVENGDVSEGEVIGVHLDIDSEGFSNIKVTTFHKVNEFSLKSLRLKNLAIDDIVKIEETAK